MCYHPHDEYETEVVIHLHDFRGRHPSDQPNGIMMIAPRPMYGISRIDQEEKKNHGWYVRVTLKGVITQKFFADKTCGGKSKALKSAQEHRNALVEQLPVARQAAAAKKRAVRKAAIA